MRAVRLIPVLVALALPALARADVSPVSPSAATNRDEARWADWDARALISEGDYDGAVQAQQQAEAARKAADGASARTPAGAGAGRP